MASTFTNLTYHVVFSTKCRDPRITTFQDELYKVIGGIIRNQHGKLIEIGGIEDHVHLLVGIPAKIAVANMARWCNEASKVTSKFQWQTGYAAFTVSYSSCEAVQQYIRNQRSHHKSQSFKEEFIELLKRHNIEYDPRYVFETEHVA